MFPIEGDAEHPVIGVEIICLHIFRAVRTADCTVGAIKKQLRPGNF